METEGDWFSFTTSGITLNELWERNPGLFYYPGSDPWWKDEPFANHRGMPRKLALRISAIPDSLNKTWDEQLKLLASGENVPTVRDLVEGMIAYYRGNGKRLFLYYWVRTSDVSSSGGRVSVGFHLNVVNVVDIGAYGADYRSRGSGLAVVRKSS